MSSHFLAIFVRCTYVTEVPRRDSGGRGKVVRFCLSQNTKTRQNTVVWEIFGDKQVSYFSLTNFYKINIFNNFQIQTPNKTTFLKAFSKK